MSSGALDAARAAAAVAALRRGAVVCTPTETFYGLAADARDGAALERVLALKGRDAARAPLALIAADLAQARAMARVWPDRAQTLAEAHWPGPLTLIVPAGEGVAPALVGPGGGVGIRVSSHPWPRALAEELGAPISATSANPHGRPEATTAAEARAYFGEGIEVYLDAGRCAAEAASTVVAVSEGGEVRVLRRGPIEVTDA